METKPGLPSASTKEKHGRCYEFRIENFLTEEEIREELSEWIDYDEVIRSRTDKVGKKIEEVSATDEPVIEDIKPFNELNNDELTEEGPEAF